MLKMLIRLPYIESTPYFNKFRTAIDMMHSLLMSEDDQIIILLEGEYQQQVPVYDCNIKCKNMIIFCEQFMNFKG